MKRNWIPGQARNEKTVKNTAAQSVKRYKNTGELIHV
jgi:hypothetical protein